MDILNYRVASLLKMEKLTNLNIPYSVYRKKQKDAKINVTIKINAHIIKKNSFYDEEAFENP